MVLTILFCFFCFLRRFILLMFSWKLLSFWQAETYSESGDIKQDDGLTEIGLKKQEIKVKDSVKTQTAEAIIFLKQDDLTNTNSQEDDNS